MVKLETRQMTFLISLTICLPSLSRMSGFGMAYETSQSDIMDGKNIQAEQLSPGTNRKLRGKIKMNE